MSSQPDGYARALVIAMKFLGGSWLATLAPRTGYLRLHPDVQNAWDAIFLHSSPPCATATPPDRCSIYRMPRSSSAFATWAANAI